MPREVIRWRTFFPTTSFNLRHQTTLHFTSTQPSLNPIPSAIPPSCSTALTFDRRLDPLAGGGFGCVPGTKHAISPFPSGSQILPSVQWKYLIVLVFLSHAITFTRSSSQQSLLPGDRQPRPSAMPAHFWAPRRGNWAAVNRDVKRRAMPKIGNESCIYMWFCDCWAVSLIWRRREALELEFRWNWQMLGV